jgi:uncharacterized RDD family membrane protein YckC
MAEYASIGSRIVAVIIDYIIIWLIMLIITLPLGMSAAFFSLVSGMANPMLLVSAMALIAAVAAIHVVVLILYFSYFESTTGQTPGKRMMKIKVVKTGGKSLNFTDAFIRTLFRIIDQIGAYLVGLVIILLSDKKQRLGDMAADTIVVKAK